MFALPFLFSFCQDFNNNDFLSYLQKYMTIADESHVTVLGDFPILEAILQTLKKSHSLLTDVLGRWLDVLHELRGGIDKWSVDWQPEAAVLTAKEPISNTVKALLVNPDYKSLADASQRLETYTETLFKWNLIGVALGLVGSPTQRDLCAPIASNSRS